MGHFSTLWELAWKSLSLTEGEKPTLSHMRQTACRLLMVIIVPDNTEATDTAHHTVSPHFPLPKHQKQSLQETREEKGTKI